MPKSPHVYTIPPQTPFIGRLVEFVLAGELGGTPDENDPFSLARTTIYLPTRRAVRSLRLEFTRQLGGKAAFLPTIRTLGDGEEDELNLLRLLPNSIEPASVVSPVYRQVQLARLVQKWVNIVSEEARELFEDEDIIIPSSTAESLWLSKELCELIDQMETEEVSWENLLSLVPDKDNFANWWQLTLEFLTIAMKNWPEHLRLCGAVDGATHRRNLLDIRTNQLTNNPPPGRVIAAGSTGSIPATARFLKSVAMLEKGALILPGLDTSLDGETWNVILGNESLSEQKPNTGCEDHPQFGLAKLLETIGINRSEVTVLQGVKSDLDTRAKLIGATLLPSAKTDQWRQKRQDIGANDLTNATRNITIIEAPAERQEATAIALILRKQIDTPNLHAALVTPDRKLARQVAAELKRFSLDIDDSGGMALANTPNVIFLRLMITVATQPPNPIALAAFVKHPYLAHDCNSETTTPVDRLFEICLLRNVLEVPICGGYEAAAREAHTRLIDASHIAPLIKAMQEDDWLQLFAFGKKLDTILNPLFKLCTTKEDHEFGKLFESVTLAALGLTTTSESTSPLFSDEGGIALNDILEEIISASNPDITCRGHELLAIFDALISGNTVRTSAHTHPRISILGPLEARLQPLDCVVLGGLNEGSWPARHDSGPFLSRPMKSTIALSTPERRTGLSAHDFEQLLGCPKVFLTRASRAENAPTVASRWLQRLQVTSGPDATEQMKLRGMKYNSWVDQLDTPDTPANRTARPCPKPAIAHRPNRLSVTEIETWIRDPYAIYAKRILKLLPLGGIGTTNEFALRGTILHDGLAHFIQDHFDPFESSATNKLMSLIDTQMQRNNIPAHLRALWRPRFAEICRDFIGHEKEHHNNVATHYCEIDGNITIGNTGFNLRGRADRIDVLKDGSVVIIDYKTGAKPTASMARTLSPQLALEGAMVLAGGFPEISQSQLSSLEYIRLRPRGDFAVNKVEEVKPPIDANEVSRMKLKELENHIESYTNPDQGYISRFAVELSKNIVGDYDHLARVREWSWGNDGEREDEGYGDE